ncbi:MAG: hypothetical protein WA951_09900 [Leeuwenhoekiella sp.]
MYFLRFVFLGVFLITLNSCASRYTTIEPQQLNYISNDTQRDVKLEYKYELLSKKYAKKEDKKGIKVVAIKITNNSENDFRFGDDLRVTYENGNEVFIMENDKVFKRLKQKPATHLFYLLLSPINIYYSDNSDPFQNDSKSFPVGLIIGPGITATNMIISASANKKFKNELLQYNINGTIIKSGETKYGLIGIKSDTYDALRLKLID